MQITMLEIGSKSKTDIQSQVVEFDGTIPEFLDEQVAEIESNKDLKLEDARFTDDKNIVIDYFSLLMDKSIRLYAFETKYVQETSKEIELK